MALGALLGGYGFGRYRDGGKQTDTELILLGSGDADAAARRRAGPGRRHDARARPGQHQPLGPLSRPRFAAEAERVAGAAGLDIEVLDEKALAEGGYGGIIGVGQGSVHPPRLVRLAYTPPGRDQDRGVRGQGHHLRLRRAVAEAAEVDGGDEVGHGRRRGRARPPWPAVAALGPAVNVVGYLPLAENMPSGTAQRPSDVITIYGGKTVEVLNTDAEGRLVLADALARSGEDSPDLLVDIATLTGAQLVALGPRIMGVMANDDEVRDGIVDAARRAGEAAWPMPLPEELRKGLDSAGGRPRERGRRAEWRDAGRRFVPEGIRPGRGALGSRGHRRPAFHEGEPYGYTPKGGTGAAVRSLVQIALDVADGRL